MPRASELVAATLSPSQIAAVQGSDYIAVADLKDVADDSERYLGSAVHLFHQTDSTAKTVNLRLPKEGNFLAAGDRVRVVIDEIPSTLVVKLSTGHQWANETTGDLTYTPATKYAAIDFIYMGDRAWSYPYLPRT